MIQKDYYAFDSQMIQNLDISLFISYLCSELRWNITPVRQCTKEKATAAKQPVRTTENMKTGQAILSR